MVQGRNGNLLGKIGDRIPPPRSNSDFTNILWSRYLKKFRTDLDETFRKSQKWSKEEMVTCWKKSETAYLRQGAIPILQIFCGHDNSKSSEWIWMKFSGKVRNGNLLGKIGDRIPPPRSNSVFTNILWSR